MFGSLKTVKRKGGVPQRMRWRDASLFEGLSGEHIDALEPFVRELDVAQGELLVREGEPAMDLFIVATGRLAIDKLDVGAATMHRIGEAAAGEVVGEVALFDELPRFASALALEDTHLYALSFHDLRPTLDAPASSSLDPRPKPLRRAYHLLLENLAGLLADRLRVQADASLEVEKQRVAVGSFLVNILVLVSVYSFMLSGLMQLDRAPLNTSRISIPLQLIFAFGSWRFIRSTGYPLHEFGLSTRNLIGSLFEALLLTAPVLALLTGVKWLVLLVTGNPNGVALVEHIQVVARLSEPELLPTLVIYTLSCAVQELIVRSALQSSLQRFLTGPRRVAQAIVVSALLFSMTHLHLSFLFAALAFIPGVYWGWLFARRPNLVGVTLSHVLVGGYVFFVMGVGL
jgi:CRP-like cAMP-binding protein